MSAHKVDDAQMAELIGAARSTVTRLRAGDRYTSAEMAERIMAATGGEVTPNDLHVAYHIRHRS